MKAIPLICAAIPLVVAGAAILVSNMPARPSPAVAAPVAPVFIVSAANMAYMGQINLHLDNRSDQTVSTMDGDLQVVWKSGLRDTYPFSFHYVDPGRDGSDSIDLSPDASVDPPAQVIIRSIDVCQLSGKYYRGCAAGMAGGTDALDPLPVTIEVQGGS